MKDALAWCAASRLTCREGIVERFGNRLIKA